MRILAWLIGLSLSAIAAGAAAQSDNISSMPGAQIKALQQRLADEGCYRGAIDGQANPALQAAVDACPSQAPILRIETGTHIATIWDIAADPKCRIVATASDDKTTRIWSAIEGRLLHTLRIPIDMGNGGKGRAVAVSPDGRYVATAGWDAEQDVDHRSFIYVFDASTGALVTRPFGFGDVIIGLAFSPDGRWLAATGGTLQSGVRVYKQC